MGKLGLFKRFKLYVGSIGWELFLWGTDITENEYWNQVYEQEKALREGYEDYED